MSNEPDPRRTSANMATETVPNEIPNNSNMTTESDHRTRVKMTTKHIEWSTKCHHERQSRLLPRDDHRDLIAMDITAERLHVEIEQTTRSSTIPSH